MGLVDSPHAAVRAEEGGHSVSTAPVPVKVSHDWQVLLLCGIQVQNTLSVLKLRPHRAVETSRCRAVCLELPLSLHALSMAYWFLKRIIRLSLKSSFYKSLREEG